MRGADALNEVPERVAELDESLRERVARDCGEFMRGHPGCRFVLACRPAGYRAARLTGDVPHAAIEELDAARQQGVVRRWFSVWTEWMAETTDWAERQAAEVWRRLSESPAVSGLAGHPLLLTIALFAHRVEKRIPERRFDFYESAARTIVQTWVLGRSGSAAGC